MSDVLGATLPQELFHFLSGPPSELRLGEAVLIATADSSGRPHPALLSYGEVRARDAGTLRFATYAASTTARNLRERSAVTFRVDDPVAQVGRWVALHGALA